MDVQVPWGHLPLPPSQPPLPVASGLGPWELCLCAYASPHMHVGPVVACECTCLLLGGLPLPPGKAMLRFLSSVLTIFLYAGNHMDPGSRPESPSFLLW